MLPNLTHRIITKFLPSSGKKIRIRPMSGREEKILLMAKEGEDRGEIITSVTQVVQNCVLDPFDAMTAPFFDVEWLFIQIRSASISNEVPVSYIDHSDQLRYDFIVDLDEVSVVKNDEVPMSLDLGGGVSVSLRWPSAKSLLDSAQAQDNVTVTHLAAVGSVDTIFDGDQAIPADEVPLEELDEFVTSFPIDAYRQLITFVGSKPYIQYQIEYTNSKGEERRIVLDKLTDFFRFR